MDWSLLFSSYGSVFTNLQVIMMTFLGALGGVLLGAFFMATDYTTTPYTPKGQIIFGIGCGIITAVIRLWGAYPEGVSYSILLMNAATPLIDRYTAPKRFGTEGGKLNAK